MMSTTANTGNNKTRSSTSERSSTDLSGSSTSTDGSFTKYLSHIDSTGKRVWSSTGKKVGRPIEWDEDKLCSLAEELIEWLQADDKNIFFYKFLAQYDLWDDMISDYSAKYESFHRLITRAKQIQEHKYVEKALINEHSSDFSKFLMKNKFGWVDKVEHQGTFLPVSINFGLLGNTPDVQPLSIPYQDIPPSQLTSGTTASNESSGTIGS